MTYKRVKFGNNHAQLDAWRKPLLWNETIRYFKFPDFLKSLILPDFPRVPWYGGNPGTGIGQQIGKAIISSGVLA